MSSSMHASQLTMLHQIFNVAAEQRKTYPPVEQFVGQQAEGSQMRLDTVFEDDLQLLEGLFLE